jgi:hypothetical protein
MLLEWRFPSGKHLNQGLARRLIVHRALPSSDPSENKRRANRQPESGVEHLFLQEPYDASLVHSPRHRQRKNSPTQVTLGLGLHVLPAGKWTDNPKMGIFAFAWSWAE